MKRLSDEAIEHISAQWETATVELTNNTSTEANSPVARRPGRRLSVEVILYLSILVLAVVSRYALLDSMTLHQDESTHAYYGWSIYTGAGWAHDAVYHGPLIYHMEALGFALVGDSDGTTRLILALFSVGTVMLPVLLRRQLGRWGALIASSLLLISPSFLYFGRFGHPDVFGAFFTLLLFTCIVRYLAEPRDAPHRDRWLYGAVLAEAMHFCAKPTAYLATGVFLLFLGARLLWQRYGLRTFWLLLGFFPAGIEDLWKAMARGAFPLQQYSVGPLSLSIVSLLPLALTGLAALGMLAWRWWEGWNEKKGDPTLDLVVVLGTMVVPLLAAIPLNVLVHMRGLEPLSYNPFDISDAALPLVVISIVACFLVAAAIGLRWDARRWAISAAIFWSIFVVLYTSFFSSMTGWVSGLVQMLGFWMTQQDVKRIYTGPQYYTIMMAVYETVSFLFGAVAAVFFAWRGLVARAEVSPGAGQEPSPATAETAEPLPPAPPFGAPAGVATSLLAFWGPATLLLFSLAGEQVPWLNLHPALPFVLLAGALLGRIVSFRPRRLRPATLVRYADLALLLPAVLLLAWAGRPLLNQAASSPVAWALSAAVLLLLAYLAFRGHGEIAFVVLGLAIILMAVLQAGAVSFAQQFADWRLAVYIPLGLLLLTAAIRTAMLGKVALRSAALVVLALLCVYSVGSAFRLTYVNNDTPAEFAVYVQTSPDLLWAVDETHLLSQLTTAGTNLGILYDGEAAWPLEWYLRDYPQRVRQETIVGPPAENMAVAFVSCDKGKDKISAPYLESRFYPYRYAFNWWFGDGAFPTPSYVARWFDPEDQPSPDTATLGTMISALANSPTQARAWRYFLYREPAGPIGAREFIFYVRRDLVPQLELLRSEIKR